MIVKENIKDPKELRTACIETLVSEADDTVCFIDTDLASSSGSMTFQKAYPERYFNIGIMEAEAIGIAAGLGVVGYRAFVHSFAPFMSRRCFDQAVVSGAYANLPMVLLGSDPGITTAYNGGTHTTFEDIAMFRSLSNTQVFDICDSVQMSAIIKLLCKDMKGLNYVRFSRRPSRKIYNEGMTFSIGKGVTIREGQDICIFASGAMLSQALDTADILITKNKSVRVIDLFSILPIDEELILKAAQECTYLVSLDNHNIRGGLGSAIADVLVEKYPKKLLKIGANTFGQVGTYDQLLELYGWTGSQLADTILKNID
ncbi:MAG: transketolase family protein [Brevinema sp.]